MGYLVLRFNSTEGWALTVRYLVLLDCSSGGAGYVQYLAVWGLTEMEAVGVMNAGIETTPAGLFP